MIPKSEAAKPGDWTCTGCSRVNFSRRYVCFHCKKAKPHTEGEEWEDHVEAVTAAAAAEAVVEEHRPAPVSPVAQVLASPQSPGTPGSPPLPASAGPDAVTSALQALVRAHDAATLLEAMRSAAACGEVLAPALAAAHDRLRRLESEQSALTQVLRPLVAAEGPLSGEPCSGRSSVEEGCLGNGT